MPTLHPAALEHQFSSLSTAEPPVAEKEGEDYVVVTPTNNNAVVSPENSFERSDDDDTNSSRASATDNEDRMLVAKTEHKLMEEKGLLDDEPLLKENPHRFVIFPIQDNDVSRTKATQ